MVSVEHKKRQPKHIIRNLCLLSLDLEMTSVCLRQDWSFHLVLHVSVFFFPHIDSSDARQTGRVSVLKGTVLLNVAAKSVLVQIKQNWDAYKNLKEISQSNTYVKLYFSAINLPFYSYFRLLQFKLRTIIIIMCLKRQHSMWHKLMTKLV